MKLEFCFLSKLAPGSVVPPHAHNVLEIVYYKTGVGEIVVGGDVWKFSENVFHIALANVAHRQTNRTALEAICVGVSGSRLEDLAGTWHDYGGQIRQPMEQLLRELNARQNYFDVVTNGLLNQIVGLCRRVIQDGGETDVDRIGKALKMIRASAGKISVEDLSETLYISKDYLRHLVKKTTGQSPLRHIIDSRMKKARQLLETTDLTVAQIADQCGFNDVYYFSRFFKRNAKLPPTAYREKHATGKCK